MRQVPGGSSHRPAVGVAAAEAGRGAPLRQPRGAVGEELPASHRPRGGARPRRPLDRRDREGIRVGAPATPTAGLSQRMFGSFLTWMQEKERGVFVVATANDLTKLPPELLRKGRFDEIFFVDLPTPQARQEIWEIELLDHNQDTENFDLAQLVQASEGFTGAKIEQCVVSSLLYGPGPHPRPPRDTRSAPRLDRRHRPPLGRSPHRHRCPASPGRRFQTGRMSHPYQARPRSPVLTDLLPS